MVFFVLLRRLAEGVSSPFSTFGFLVLLGLDGVAVL
jgi:hypothetical protein